MAFSQNLYLAALLLCGTFSSSVKSENFSEVADVVEMVLALPEGEPEQFLTKVAFQGGVLTLNLEKTSVVGENTQFLIADGASVLKPLSVSSNVAYLGTVRENPDFSLGAVLTGEGLLATIVRPGEESIVVEPIWGGKEGTHRVFEGKDYEQGVVSSPDRNRDSPEKSFQAGAEYAASEGPIVVKRTKAEGGSKSASSAATLPPARVMEVLEFEVGVEIGSRAFENNYGSNLASAQAAAASIATNMDARYLRGAGIKHVLGTVIIRTNAGTDPLRDLVTSNSSGSLRAFRDYWNSNAGVVGNTHDLAVYHVRAGPSGLAYVNSVGSGNRYALSCSNGPTSWANGTLVHEFGHSWNLRHNNDAPIEVYDYNNEEIPARFYEAKPRNNSGSNAAGGGHTFVSVMNGSGNINIGRLSTEEANTVYSAAQNKRGFADVISNPSPIPPFGQMDEAFVAKGSAVTIDVIANDHDANNDVLDAVLLDSVSQQGGTIALSAGTGPGGRNELVYTAPINPEDEVDFFHYTVCDSTGRTDFGAVYVTIGNELLFAESFVYPNGALAGNTNAGMTWTTLGGTGSSEITVGESLSAASSEGLVTRGGKVVQTANRRAAITLPASAISGADGTVRFISFLQRFTTAEISRSRIIEFWNGGTSGNDTAFSFGTDTNTAAPDYGLLIDKNGADVALELGPPDTEPHLVVLKVEYGAGDADTISVFLDPGAEEPLVANAMSSQPNMAFDRIGFGTFQSGGQELDEIRIGTTYESVVPQPKRELFFEESFAYDNGDLAGKTNAGLPWVDEQAGGATTIPLGAGLTPASPSEFLGAGSKAAQAGNDRLSLALDEEVAGGQEHSTRYISFVQKLAFADAGKSQIIEFWNGTAISNNTAFSFGTDTNPAAPDYGLFIDKGDGDIALELGPPSLAERLVVLKVDYGAGGGDSISVFLDPGEDEPTMPNAISVYSSLAFNRIGMAAFQNGGQEVDEIRIGATYHDVVPLIPSGLLFEETFPYPAGLLSGNTKQADIWSDIQGDGVATVDANESVALPGFSNFAASGGSVEQLSSDRVELALPESAFGGRDNSVRYIAFIQKLGVATADKSQIVEFWNGAATSDNTAFSFGTDTNPAAPDYGLFIDKDGGNVPLDLGSPDGEAHLVVFKVEYGANDADQISVFLDPGASEPAVPDATSAYTNLAFNRIGFGAFQGGSQSVDEIRVGTTYADVVPTTGVDPDSDSDGLPDDFERANYHPSDLTATDGTDDLDGDGMSDANEFIAGTDATDANSVLRIRSLALPSETEVFVEWDSIAGIDYSVWSSEMLTEESWVEVVASTIATGPVTSETVLDSNPKKFFQVRVNP